MWIAYAFALKPRVSYIIQNRCMQPLYTVDMPPGLYSNGCGHVHRQIHLLLGESLALWASGSDPTDINADRSIQVRYM